MVSGSASPLQPRGNVHPIAKHVTLPLDDVTRVDADADMDLLGFLFLRVIGCGTALESACAHCTAWTTEGKSTKKASPMVLMTWP